MASDPIREALEAAARELSEATLDRFDEAELRAQLDHARSLRFAPKELIWLAGNSFYGKTQMFAPDFIAWLGEFQLPEYELRRVDGQLPLAAFAVIQVICFLAALLGIIRLGLYEPAMVFRA